MNRLVRFNVAATATFVVVTVLAAWIFSPAWRTAVVVVDLVLFAIGVVTFLLGFFSAVQRSRTEEISVSTLFLLLGGVAEKSVVRWMNGCLTVQVVVGIAGAIVRGSTDGRPGSTLAFGVLVAMLGLGLNGWWGARYGRFPDRGSSETA
ncbi:MAG: hypothetical protein ACKOFZ_02525 [Ilumatobacteraceae bacterium]|jgi:hypothetical protein